MGHNSANTNIHVVTIDGPSGVGKGTLAKSLSQQLGFHLLDSGAIYRLAALASVQQGIEPISALVALCHGLDICFISEAQSARVMLDGEDVTLAIRQESIGQRASMIAAIPEVRQALLQRQRDFAKPPGLVADGRDMGTVVFPDAKTKLFLTASSHVRAQRRFEQLQSLGQVVDYNTILYDIEQRDIQDSQRAVAPLRPAEDATIIDTSDLSIVQVQAIALEACAH